MLPPLHRLPVRPTGMPAKTRRMTKDEETFTEAQKLVAILNDLTSDSSRSIDWVLALSDTQFDMLLAIRLYTGSLYSIMTRVFFSDDVRLIQPYGKSTAEVVKRLLYGDHGDEALYYALCNAHRRNPEEMYGPLFADGLGERAHLQMSEEQFRTSAAVHLTNYVHHDTHRLLSQGVGMARRVMDRVSGDGLEFNELQTAPEYRDAWPDNFDDLVKHAREDFWFGMRHIAGALQSLIIDSKVVVGSKPIPAYRGMTDELSVTLANESFTSLSWDQELARAFTSNPDLEPTSDAGALNQCCMMRVSLLPGTPYLDVDDLLTTSNGWGFALGEKELLLPVGLNWEHSTEGAKKTAKFPPEIYETDEGYGDDDEPMEMYYEVEYFTVGPK